ncbi:MAG TPA: NnrU family protein [Ignavibacteriaceae bacterium]|nr:NnrU family protein [Ignavibacteriaceae bacterium]
MKKIFVFGFGLVSYLIFFAIFLYWIGFMVNLWVPKGIDDGINSPLLAAIFINFLLVALFGLQHSIMARGKFKKWITRIIPKAAERSVYVLISSLIFILIFWQWRPIDITVWNVENSTATIAIYGLFVLGWILLLISTFLINHFELFGLQQIYTNLRNKPMKYPEFQMPLLYRIVRHPMMIGVIFAVWATPRMTLGHLMFSILMTVYIMIGTYYEEQDLVKNFGAKYIMYRNSVPKMIPVGKKKRPNELSAK